MTMIKLFKYLTLLLMICFSNAQAASNDGGKAQSIWQERDIQKRIFYIGDADAPITFVEFYSQSCPWTSEFRLNVFDRLKEKYIDTGKVYFVAIPFIHHDDDMKLAKYVQCTSDENFWAIQKTLFETREKWIRKTKQGEVLSQTDFNFVARTAENYGITGETRKQCLKDKDMESSLLNIRRASTIEFGVINTPHYVIADKTYHEMTWADVDWLISEELSKRGAQ